MSALQGRKRSTMKSISELLDQLGLSNLPSDGIGNGWPLLDRIQSEGSVVVVKLDGERHENRYTLVITGGLLGENYFRKDSDDLGDLIRDAVNFYDSLIWSRTDISHPA